MKNNRICIKCNVPMAKTFVTYKNMKFEARQCPKCKDKIFTEDLAIQAVSQMEARKVKDEYKKNPIRIGNSWGVTFPKPLVDFFNLDNPEAGLSIHANIKKRKIEIDV